MFLFLKKNCCYALIIFFISTLAGCKPEYNSFLEGLTPTQVQDKINQWNESSVNTSPLTPPPSTEIPPEPSAILQVTDCGTVT